MTFRFSTAALLALLVAVPLPGVAESSAPQRTDQIIVKYLAGSEALSRGPQRLATTPITTRTGKRMALKRGMSTGAHIYRLEQAVTVAEAHAIAREIEASNADVYYAEPDRILHPMASANDNLYSSQWNLQSSEPGGMHVDVAWDTTMGTNSIVIGVVDTGIVNHVDLDIGGNIVLGYDFISLDTLTDGTKEAATANDGDGRDPSPLDPGDWIESGDINNGPFANCTIANSSWHGTHIAGEIAAKTNNATGVAGIAPNTTLLIARALGKCGGYLSDVVDAMLWSGGQAASLGIGAPSPVAHIINLSLGGIGECSITEQTAIDTLNAAGKAVVVSSGNVTAGSSGVSFSPASCDDVINIGAVNRSGSAPSYSNLSERVTVSAPGGDSDGAIWSTVDSGTKGPTGSTYKSIMGTSMAAGQASGVIALMLANHPLVDLSGGDTGQTWRRIARKLQITATPWGSVSNTNCTNSTCGAGIINAQNAVELPLADAGDMISVVPGETGVSLKGYASDAGGGAIVSTLWQQTGGEGVILSDAAVLEPTFTAPATPQNLVFTLSATDDEPGTPNTVSDSVTVVVNAAPALEAIPDITKIAGETVDFTVTATDPNNTPIIYSASGLPSGASFGTTDGQFFWDNVGPAGSYTITITATDSIDPMLKDSQAFTISVVGSANRGGGGLLFWLLPLLVAISLSRRFSRHPAAA